MTEWHCGIADSWHITQEASASPHVQLLPEEQKLSCQVSSAHLVNAETASPVTGLADVRKEQLGPCHLQRRANARDPTPCQQVLEGGCCATANHACSAALPVRAGHVSKPQSRTCLQFSRKPDQGK